MVCLLLDLVKEKISFCLKIDFVGEFRPFLVDFPSGNHDIRFLLPRFYKDSVLSSLCGVAVWSDLIVNFGGIVTGIELSLKLLSFELNYEHRPAVRHKFCMQKSFHLHLHLHSSFTTVRWQLCHRCHSLSMDARSSPVAHLEDCFLSYERIFFVKLSDLVGLVTYFQLVKIIPWKCKHKKIR